jgi:chemotaxis protein MotB
MLRWRRWSKVGKVRVTQTGRGVTVEINAKVLFEEGQAAGGEARARWAVAGLLKGDPHAIQVEGHTDNADRQSGVSVELGTVGVRASSVVRLFIEGVAAERLTAVGHGANLPVAPNTDERAAGAQPAVAVTILVLHAGCSAEWRMT